MAAQLRPGNSTQLNVGYSFTMDEVYKIYMLYSTFKWSLTKIRQEMFNEAHITEIACAITHAKLDIQGLPFDQRPRFSYDPSAIDLTDFRV